MCIWAAIWASSRVRPTTLFCCLRHAQELESPISPSRLFKALMLDSHNLLPQLVPQSIESIVFCEGKGGVGTIRQTNFARGCLIRYAKHRIDELDVENCRCKYTLIEGDIIDEKLKWVEYELEFTEDGHGGCICKMSSNYWSDQDIEFRDEDIEFGKERAMEVYKAIEDYLLANPNAYA